MNFQSGEIDEDRELSTRSDRLSSGNPSSDFYRLLAGVMASGGLIIFLLLIFVCGIMIGGTALHDPDTCWLVATGKYIVEHGQIPVTDPFSYTFGQLHRPWIVYQWLAEVCFYSAVRVGGLVALVCLVSLLVVTAFVALPLRAFSRAGIFLGGALSCIAVSILSASFHFLARPEIFSYVFGSCFLYLLTFHRLRLESDAAAVQSGSESASQSSFKSYFQSAAKSPSQLWPKSTPPSAAESQSQPSSQFTSESSAQTTDESKARSAYQQVDWKVVSLLSLIMAVWVNFHTGFISAFVVLSLYCAVSVCARLVCGVRPWLDKTSWLALLFCACVSILNPIGLGLWKYIPELFFARFNPMIAELKPINALGFACLPFLVLVAALLATWMRRLMRHVKTAAGHRIISKPDMALLAVSLSIIIVVSAEACRHQRVIPFTVLALIYEYLILSGKTDLSELTPSETPLRLLTLALQNRLATGFMPGMELGGIRFGLFALIVAVGGTLLTSVSIQKPVLPQSGKAFSAPFAAMERMAAFSKSDPGNLFNDAQFGDCLIWYHPGDPKVFIDTRYDMYGEDFIHDYLQIMSLDPKHPELLRKYKIKYVFARTDSNLIKALSARQSSKRLYGDEVATILQVPEGGI